MGSTSLLPPFLDAREIATIGSGELYRLGRPEFVLAAWEYPFRIYTNIHTDAVIV